MDPVLLILGLIVNLPIGYLAIRKESLTIPDGVLAAGILGYTLFVIHPLFWVIMVVFFGSSTLLTRFQDDNEIKKEAIQLAEKGGQRDMWQVLANGGIPLALAIYSLTLNNPGEIDLTSSVAITIVISFAVVNADTWATELGVTSTSPPYWILDPRKTVPRGTSGGISPRGLVASLSASLLIATLFGLGLLLLDQFTSSIVITITFSGLIGSLFDSLLGATIQAQYYCPTCDKLTEQQSHSRCGTTTTHDRGLLWFNNDLVNLFSVLLTVVVLSPFLG